MSELDQLRRELERKKSGGPTIRVCPDHGEYFEVCVGCYSVQAEKIERESLPLRYANTAPALRARVLAELSTSNGHGH